MPYLETNGIETYYEDYGEGHPIIVLHGALDDHRVWAEQLQPLADEYRIIPYDLRGHGKTGVAPTETFTMEQYVDDLQSIIDEMNLSQPTVLGHSFGGMVGYRFASEYPEMLSSLVTVGSATPQVFSAGEWIVRIGVPAVTTPILGNDRVMNGLLWLQDRLFGEEAAGDMSEMEQVRESHSECEMPDVTGHDRSDVMRAVQEYMRSELNPERIETDLLMMYGENEPMIENHGEYLGTNLTACRSVEVPNASHNAQTDDSAFIREEIREFLSSTLPQKVAN